MDEPQHPPARVQAWTFEAGRMKFQPLHEVPSADSSAPSPSVTWIDIKGSPAAITEALRELVGVDDTFRDLDSERAAQGGDNPPSWPPKAKAFHEAVFARAYWLGPKKEDHRLVAQEIHVIASPTRVVTMRYPCLAWDVQQPQQSSPDSYERGDIGLDIPRAQKSVVEFEARRQSPAPAGVLGLEVAEVLLDQIIDSLFDTSDVIREWGDNIEGDVLKGAWLDTSLRKQPHPNLYERLVGLRRLVRRIRWAFLPPDEINEFLSGPFLALEDKALQFAFKDLEREAKRALETVRELSDQLDQVAELRNTMRADRLNDTTYVLTAVATVLLIPAVIAGIYGMNFLHMPELTWRWGYPAALVAMVTLGVGIWLFVHRLLRTRR